MWRRPYTLPDPATRAAGRPLPRMNGQTQVALPLLYGIYVHKPFSRRGGPGFHTILSSPSGKISPITTCTSESYGVRYFHQCTRHDIRIMGLSDKWYKRICEKWSKRYHLHLENTQNTEKGNDETDDAQGHARSVHRKMELRHRRVSYMRLTSVITNLRNETEIPMSLKYLNHRLLFFLELYFKNITGKGTTDAGRKHQHL